MVRSTFKIEYIENDVKRKQTLRKRKASLVKEVGELKTLCDVDACIIIYSNGAEEPDVWPSREEAQRVLQRFQDTPTMTRENYMTNSESLISKGIVKLNKGLKEKKKKNNLIEKLVKNNSSEEDLLKSNNVDDLKIALEFLDQKLSLIDNKIAKME